MVHGAYKSDNMPIAQLIKSEVSSNQSQKNFQYQLLTPETTAHGGLVLYKLSINQLFNKLLNICHHLATSQHILINSEKPPSFRIEHFLLWMFTANFTLSNFTVKTTTSMRGNINNKFDDMNTEAVCCK